eukprot:TRINITY_DN5566_c0_g1_i1.p1 TRINITY_DN5566_c0_g1~~TRINITY_DN5566_c0_g1_i1.p1  ORF type:complete len:536 (-),score=91.81 TRINITY_DN5566_c0_g1_i1:57-1445(-)
MIGGNPCIVREEPLGSGIMRAFATHSETFSTPVMNEVQNCELLEYNRISGESWAKFRRPLIGCKPDDCDIVEDWDMRYIAAWGDDQVFSYHAERRAMTEFNAVLGPPPSYTLPDDAVPFDAVLGEHAMPEYRDIYMCRGMSFPADRRYHIVLSEPVLHIDDISPAAHHHFNIFACPFGIPPDYQDGQTRPCNSAVGLPPVGCFQFFTTWLAGQGPLWFMEAGMPIGTGEGAVMHVVIQGHVDNPSGAGGWTVPPWGLRLWYTPTLRPIESGNMGLVVGLPFENGGIQPGIPAYHLFGECASGCTGGGSIPPEGITVTGIAPHAHYHAKSIWVQLVRQDNATGEWAEVARLHHLRYWDANFQGMRARQPLKVLPGDRIVMNCIYDTTTREDPLGNGEGYEDEMCMFSMNYYPLTPMASCLEYPGDIGISLCDAEPYVSLAPELPFTSLPDPPNVCAVGGNLAN